MATKTVKSDECLSVSLRHVSENTVGYIDVLFTVNSEMLSFDSNVIFVRIVESNPRVFIITDRFAGFLVGWILFILLQNCYFYKCLNINFKISIFFNPFDCKIFHKNYKITLFVNSLSKYEFTFDILWDIHAYLIAYSRIVRPIVMITSNSF